MYKCIIVDDDLLDRDALEMYASKIDGITIEAVCTNGIEAATVLQQKQIDIVFSDIDMPNLSGLELKQSLQNAPVFIFISSHLEYAAESYNLDVIDFIAKPVSFARLLKATNKAIEYIELKNKVALQTPVNTTTTSDTIFIKDDSGLSQIKLNDIICMESLGNFSKIHTVQKTHITLVSLKNIEDQLTQAQFIRVHKQYVVNLQQIVLLASNGELLLTNEIAVPVGNMYKAALTNIIQSKTLLR
jgi:two-component system LytT family response regulator